MNVLTPVAGLTLAAALVPALLLLYFLRLRRKPAPIASTLLWQRSVEDLRANAPFQRLRRSLLLFLQLLAILLLAAAVAQPQIQGGSRRGVRTILLVDVSASMNATDAADGATRLEEAKARAKRRVEALHAGTLFRRSAAETMVIAFADRAEIAAKFSTSRRELLEAIDRIRPTDGRTLVADALRLARAYTTNVDPDSDRPVGDPAVLELFSDGRVADIADQVLRGEELIYHRVGAPETPNVGVTALAAERPADRLGAVEVFATLANHGESEARCDVQLAVDGTARAVVEVRIPPATRDAATGAMIAGRTGIAFTPIDLDRGAVVEVANLRADALAADDRALAVVPPPKRLAAAIVTAGRSLVRTVLEGIALRELVELSPEDFARLAANGGLARFDVIVLDGWAPTAGALPDGRYLVLGPPPPIPGLNPFGAADEGQIALASRGDHPVLRYAEFDQLVVAKGALIQPDDDVRVLVDGSRGPLVVAVSRGGVQAVYVTFSPADSNWPFLRSFVTFLYNAVDFLGHAGEGVTEEGVRPGDAIVVRLDGAPTAATIELPDGERESMIVREGGIASYGPVRRAGLHRIRWNGASADAAEERDVAVNLLDEAESGIAAATEVTIGAEAVADESGDDLLYTPLWPYAVGLVLIVLTLEWWLYHKRAGA